MGTTPALEQLAPCIGAEVRGVDLRDGRERDLALVREALARHHVVVIGGQDLDDVQLHAFAASFGQVARLPDRYADPGAVPGLYDIDGDEVRVTRWHTDLTFEPSPSWLGILAAKIVPELGGDTLWVNMSAAHSRLSPAFARFLLPLDAEHTSAGLTIEDGPLRSMVHPVVTARPATGEPVLYVNPLWTQRIVGLEPAESSGVLTALFEIATATPEIELRHRWRPGDVVVWDMRSTLHRAVDDYGDRGRVLRRASVLCDRPSRFGGSWPDLSAGSSSL